MAFDTDPLLRPETIEAGAHMLVEHGSETRRVPCELLYVRSPQMGRFLSSRGMADFSQPGSEAADGARLAAVREYYHTVDADEYDAVRQLFASDASVNDFTFLRHTQAIIAANGSERDASWSDPVPIGLVPAGTTYFRCNQILSSKDKVDDFFTPEGRRLRGKHLVETIVAIRGLVFALGEFTGTSADGMPLQRGFADAWHFLAADLKVRERRTYLRGEFARLMSVRERPVTPADLLRQITLRIRSDCGMMAEVIGFPHNPDLANVCCKWGDSDPRMYFNVDAEQIR